MMKDKKSLKEIKRSRMIKIILLAICLIFSAWFSYMAFNPPYAVSFDNDTNLVTMNNGDVYCTIDHFTIKVLEGSKDVTIMKKDNEKLLLLTNTINKYKLFDTTSYFDICLDNDCVSKSRIDFDCSKTCIQITSSDDDGVMITRNNDCVNSKTIKLDNNGDDNR